MAGIRARSGKVTVELDSVLSDQIDAMMREMAPTVAAKMDAYLNGCRQYIDRAYPRPNDPRYPTATGNSLESFQYFRDIEQRGDSLVISATVLNDASNYGKISRLRGRRAHLQDRLERGDNLSPEELRELRVIQALENIKGRKGLIPYVVFVHRGRYWQHLRRMRKLSESDIVGAAAAELRRIAGG